MSLTPVWRGTELNWRKADLTKVADGAVEYVEIWIGNRGNGSWPNYSIGAVASPLATGPSFVGALYWYNIHDETGHSKAMGTYTARASNRYSSLYASWSMNFGVIIVEDFFLAQHLAVPTISKTTYHFTAPPTSGVLPYAQTPVGHPFGTLISNFTKNGVAYQWWKTEENVQQSENGFQRVDVWKFGNYYTL